MQAKSWVPLNIETSGSHPPTSDFVPAALLSLCSVSQYEHSSQTHLSLGAHFPTKKKQT